MQIEKKFYNEKHRPYYICAPGYARVSNGVRAMHLLCHYLNKLGEEAYVFSPETQPKLRTPYLTQDILNRHKASNRSPIVVYPEVVHGNPLRAAAVVRYILNHPGLLGGPKDYPPTDMMVFWQEDYVDFSKYPDPSYIFIPSIDTAIFNNDDNPHDQSRQTVLVYPGRYKQAQQDFPELFQDAVVITYDWPQSHEELSALLRQAKVLYTFANSAIISEALLCGCPVVIKETVFTKKPEERAGSMQALALPGTTFDATPEAIERARGSVAEYQQVYHQYQLELLQQLEAFITASQKLPCGDVNEVVCPSFLPQAAPSVSLEQARYDAWVDQHRLQGHHAQIHAERMVRAWSSQPSIIIMMPLTADRLQDAMKTVTSLAQQLYKQWQLIFVADFDAPSESFLQSEIMGWLRIDDARDAEQLTQAYAAVLDGLPCDWVGILPPGAELENHALLMLGDYASLHPDWHAIYCDDDIQGPSGKREQPAFKPDFNLDHLLGTDYIGMAVWFKREALQSCGGLAGCPGADLYDAVLRIRDAHGGGTIGHIAAPLIHLPPHAPAFGSVGEARAKALAAHFARHNLAAAIAPGLQPDTQQIVYPVLGQPLVSIIVADAGDGLSLTPCIESLLATTSHPRYEILVVTADATQLPPSVSAMACAEESSLASRYQLGAAAADGDYLVFLDSRVEAVQADWLSRLLGLMSRPEVGAAAPRLLASDGGTIWRGPYLLGADDGAAALFSGADIAQPGHLNRQHVEHNPGAVSMDCLLIDKALYQQLGGMDASLPDHECAGIDLCQKVRAAGRLIVWTPFASVLRHGGLNEAAGLSDAGQDALQQCWYGRLAADPAYNRNLSLDSAQAFQVDSVFANGWDVNFHERQRILALPNDSSASARRLQAPLRQLQEDGHCQLAWIPQGYRAPRHSEIERLAPDVLVQNMRFDPAFLDWQRRNRQLRPDTLSVLVLDTLAADPAVTPRYAAALLREVAGLVDRIIVPSERLKEVAGRLIEDVRLVPDALAEAPWANLTSQRRLGKKARAGWVGAIQDADDLLLLRDAMEQTAGEIEWVVLGHCPDALRASVAEHHPFDLADETYPAKLAGLNLDLAVMPKASHALSEAESPTRLLEYGALGIPLIGTARAAIQAMQAPVAMVENDTLAWIEALQKRARDPSLAGREGDALRDWVRENHLLSQRLSLWQAAVSR